jgi:hypothetical protein
MAFIVLRGIDGAGGVEIDVTRGAERFVRAENRLERRGSIGGSDDGLVNPVGGVVGEFDEQEELREGVVFERDAFGQPALGNREQLREEPGLVVAVIVAEYFSSVSFGQQKGNLVLSAALGVRGTFTYDGCISVLVRMSEVESARWIRSDLAVTRRRPRRTDSRAHGGR